MSVDYRDLRADVEKAMSKKREDFVAHEMSAYSGLDHWWGVPGISKPLGMPEDMGDDSLESLARTYRRGLEDVRDGLARRAAPDLSVKQVEKNLEEIEKQQRIREALRHSWGASERGTNEKNEFLAAGGLEMLAEAKREGQEPLIRPSYKLALFMDYTRWLCRELCVFDWSQTISEVERDAMWCRKACHDEYRGYALWGRETTEKGEE